jgi:hypothetical protein
MSSQSMGRLLPYTRTAHQAQNHIQANTLAYFELESMMKQKRLTSLTLLASKIFYVDKQTLKLTLPKCKL